MINRFRFLGVCVLALTLFGAAGIAVAAEQAAPDFVLKSGTGQNVRLKELRGQVVMINFWATWCGPCREEMPQLDRIYKQYRASGFTLLGVNVDDKADSASAMAKRLGVSFPILFDTEKKVSRLYDVNTMPSTLLIDRNGRLRHVQQGYRSGFERKYEEQVRELLKE